MAKISKTCPLCDVTFRKPPTKTENCFFSILSTRLDKSVEGLNSSLALAAGDLWPKKGPANRSCERVNAKQAKTLSCLSTHDCDANDVLMSLEVFVKKTPQKLCNYLDSILC